MPTTVAAFCFRNVIPEGGEVGGVDVAGFDGGGDAGAERVVIGIDAGRAGGGVEVGLEVDEAGGDDVVADLDDFAALRGGNAGGDLADAAFGDGDVEAAVAFVFGVDDAAAFENEVVDLGFLGGEEGGGGEEEEGGSHGITS